MLLKIAGLSKQSYLYQIKHFDNKAQKDKFYEDLILDIFKSNYRKYGIPRITIEINRRLLNAGLPRINHKRVERLMIKLGIQARPKQRKYVSYKGDVGRIAPNLINRDFSTGHPYEKIGTDVTVFIMPFGKLYLSPIIDFHTREVLAYDLSESPDFRQINNMFEQLIRKHGINVTGAIMHSDQGWQYQMEKYHLRLAELKIVQSMSRKGNCLDNSPTENFFGRMKEEMFYGKEHIYKDMQDLKNAICEYIEYYNYVRIVKRLGMSPIEYRLTNYGLI